MVSLVWKHYGYYSKTDSPKQIKFERANILNDDLPLDT